MIQQATSTHASRPDAAGWGEVVKELIKTEAVGHHAPVPATLTSDGNGHHESVEPVATVPSNVPHSDLSSSADAKDRSGGASHSTAEQNEDGGRHEVEGTLKQTGPDHDEQTSVAPDQVLGQVSDQHTQVHEPEPKKQALATQKPSPMLQ